MILNEEIIAKAKETFPRASGGDPIEQDTKEVFEDFSPRERG